MSQHTRHANGGVIFETRDYRSLFALDIHICTWKPWWGELKIYVRAVQGYYIVGCKLCNGVMGEKYMLLRLLSGIIIIY